MANEMKSMTFGGVTHPIYDNDAIKSASMTGSNLELKDGDGNIKSTVAIPTSGVKYTTFKVGTNSATYGELCYIDDTPLTGAKPGEFIYVAPLYDTLTAFGYWIQSQQSQHGNLFVKGIIMAPINQPLMLMVIENNGNSITAQYVPTSPKNTHESMLADKTMTLLDAYKALCSWKPCHARISDRAVRLYSDATKEYAYASSSVNSNYRVIFCYADGTYASLIPLASGQDTSRLDHCQHEYTNMYTWTDPNPCIDEPEAISIGSTLNDEMYITALDTDGTVGELVPVDGRGQSPLPNNFAIALGHWI